MIEYTIVSYINLQQPTFHTKSQTISYCVFEPRSYCVVEPWHHEQVVIACLNHVVVCLFQANLCNVGC